MRVAEGRIVEPKQRSGATNPATPRSPTDAPEARPARAPPGQLATTDDQTRGRSRIRRRLLKALRRAKSGVAAGRLFSLPALISPILTLPHEKSAADLSALSWREGAENERDVNSRQPHFLLSEPLFS